MLAASSPDAPLPDGSVSSVECGVMLKRGRRPVRCLMGRLCAGRGTISILIPYTAVK